MLFKFVRLLLISRACVQAKSEGVKFKEGEELPETIDFLDFIFEVCLLFDSLGKAGFSFVKSDLETKSGIIRVIHDKNPEDNHTLQQVNYHFRSLLSLLLLFLFIRFIYSFSFIYSYFSFVCVLAVCPFSQMAIVCALSHTDARHLHIDGGA
jgi:hypothetical protein